MAVGRSFVTREDRIDWLEEMRLPALVMTGCEDKGSPCAGGASDGRGAGCPFREIPGPVTSRPWRTPRSSTRRSPNFCAAG